MKLVFTPFNDPTNRAHYQQLLKDDGIFESFRADGDSRDFLITHDYPGSYVGIVHENDQPAGFIVMLAKAPALYEIHLGFNGMDASKIITSVEQAINAMFISSDALHIIAPCHDFNPQLERLAQLFGARERFTSKGGYVRDGKAYDCKFYGKFFSEWVFEVVGNMDISGIEGLKDDTTAKFYKLALWLFSNGQSFKAQTAWNLFASMTLQKDCRIQYSDAKTTVVDIAGKRLVFELGNQPCQ